MNNLTQNYKLIFKELTNLCSPITSIKQIRKPKLSDLELVALNLTAEYMSYNSELQLVRTIYTLQMVSIMFSFKKTTIYGKVPDTLFNPLLIWL
ncbi:hypothetical protein EZS27_005843 [termite gut metagenome]|uniref:Transposase n=1 Tax=termite gut metagenome TaxID=433724 RepID=A0A5J4SNB6_9ZZZZ